ncbi:MAG TPA: RNA 2',3'-cyclic phosphodiesterase [Baekduia sp.]|nr:RNA 2',3'-cyclic phosphodiesterase [Baekduia sp.]
MSARLFVAVEVGEGDREALAAWAREAVGDDAGLRLVPPDHIHLTLAFLGHRALDEVQPLSALVERWDGAPAPALRTAGALWLSPRRPHVLTVAVEDRTAALAELHDAVWTALEDEADPPIRRERRAFRPHLTVARVRRGWPPPARRLPELPARDLDAGGLVLFRSWLGGGPRDGEGAHGARYEPLARAVLSARS